MNWVDVLVLLLALLAAVSGARQGVVIALPAFLGVIGGAVLGIQVAPILIGLFDHPAGRVALAIGTVVLLVALGETFGVWIGNKLKRRISSATVSGVDSTLGAVVQGAVVFVVAWLIALPLTSVAGLPGLTRAINNSAVLGSVNSMIPDAAQGLPSELRELLDESGFPSIVDPFEKAPVREIEEPDPGLQDSQVVHAMADSVLKIRGVAPSCSRSLEGSGFVIAPERVMTNAHVVAGTTDVSVEAPKGRRDARVVHYDPGRDIAVLAVPGLDPDPVPLASSEAGAGDDAIALGYPLDGPYTATATRVREQINLRGPDIYDRKTVERDVVTLRGQVRSGNSGGPLVGAEGEVIGMVFGASVEEPDTGFGLTVDEIRNVVERAPTLRSEVATGPCTS